ncbi:hypothetical protein E4U58_002618 [Claviceps cyperi]|nr:hypothetical protein E4U58_002618 [Claviceps cyperi]
MDLCPLITATSIKRELSPFCRLFSEREWPAASTQGVGYVNGLIARLTGYPVEDETSTDPDVDSDSDTFPLDRHLHTDFAYDSTLMTVNGALAWSMDERVRGSPLATA